MKRLENPLKRLRKDPEALGGCDTVITEQLQRGIVEIVEKPCNCERKKGKVNFIPHNAPIKRDKATAKLRVVYDASVRSNGVALNDCLFTDPSLEEHIFDVRLRFRANSVALTGDVEKEFLMVGMAEEDRDVLRFLWVDDIEESSPEIVVLMFTCVVFRVSSSPFLPNAIIKHNIARYKEAGPEFVERFSSIYVNDLTSGAPDVNAAYELCVQAQAWTQAST